MALCYDTALHAVKHLGKIWHIDHCAKISAQWLPRDLQRNRWIFSTRALCQDR